MVDIMKIEKFNINNYRAIKNIEFDIKHSISPIIGVNESGKTTILKAILAFDKSRDKFNNGDHLEYKNRYFTHKHEKCTITAYLTLSEDEIAELIKKTNIKTSSDEYPILANLNIQTIFQLTRTLDSEKNLYSTQLDNLSADTCERIAKYLSSKIPYILYFDDFADRVPDTIEFPTNYMNEQKLSHTKQREWQEIIQEIFNRANTEASLDDQNGETLLASYLKKAEEDEDVGNDILSDVQQTLNNEITSEWIKIKRSGISLGDNESEALEIEIVHQKNSNSFQFKVKDKSNNGKSRTFDISQRSKGFQWFFNYMVKLKFNPNYKGELENSIFLLDEPGSYLHSSAQSELLKELQKVSIKNTIIYCTHSQFLLNPDYIKVGSIKITEKQDSEISLKNFGSYKGQNHAGALSPIYQALQLNIAHDYLGKIALTEGITDYYFFKMLQNNTDLINKEIKFIAGGGASHLDILISLAVSFSENFIILLDHDKAGKQAKKKYIDTFTQSLEENILFYNTEKDNFVLEDLLSGSDSSHLLEITKSDDKKRAWGFLYYDYKDKQKDFFENLDQNTLKNLSHISKKLNLL